MLATVAALIFGWLVYKPDINETIAAAVFVALVGLWLLGIIGLQGVGDTYQRPDAHMLLANDRLGFMPNLRLDAKTAVIDGSNIYHFGHDNGYDAQPLGGLAHQLRAEGYRIVCFFDANIFYTLRNHGAFPDAQSHSATLLQDIFGLRADEIYVVPSGVQADLYVLETLRHLPISFAVTNDRYRDYAKKYRAVMQNNQWRKGIAISKNEIRLWQYRFTTPIRLR